MSGLYTAFRKLFFPDCTRRLQLKDRISHLPLPRAWLMDGLNDCTNPLDDTYDWSYVLDEDIWGWYACEGQQGYIRSLVRTRHTDKSWSPVPDIMVPRLALCYLLCQIVVSQIPGIATPRFIRVPG